MRIHAADDYPPLICAKSSFIAAISLASLSANCGLRPARFSFDRINRALTAEIPPTVPDAMNSAEVSSVDLIVAVTSNVCPGFRKLLNFTARACFNNNALNLKSSVTRDSQAHDWTRHSTIMTPGNTENPGK